MNKLICFFGISLALLISFNSEACTGYAGPGGPCYSGPGGCLYTGPGGGCYNGPGGGGTDKWNRPNPNCN